MRPLPSLGVAIATGALNPSATNSTLTAYSSLPSSCADTGSSMESETIIRATTKYRVNLPLLIITTTSCTITLSHPSQTGDTCPYNRKQDVRTTMKYRLYNNDRCC